MSILSLFRRNPAADIARRLFDTVVQQSRMPDFYSRLAVPDTLDGRFDLMVLHVFLLIDRLHGEADAADLPQAVVDRMFTILDLNLREMGVQDVGIGKRIKKMAEGFNGRITAYRTALASDLASDEGVALRAALRRNVFGEASVSDAQVDALCAYVRAAVAALRAMPASELIAGTVTFPDPSSLERQIP